MIHPKARMRDQTKGDPQGVSRTFVKPEPEVGPQGSTSSANLQTFSKVRQTFQLLAKFGER